MDRNRQFLAGAVLVCLTCGAVEGALTGAGQGGLASVLLSASLWGMCSLVALVAWTIAWLPTGASWPRTLTRMHGVWTSWGRARATAADGRRAVDLVLVVVCLGIWAAAGALWSHALITHRNDATLIAVGAVAGQVLLAIPAVWCFVVLRHWTERFGPRFVRMGLTTQRVVKVGVLLAVSVGVWLRIARRDLWFGIEADVWSSLALAFLAAILLGERVGRWVAPRRPGLLVCALAVATVVGAALGASVDRARKAVSAASNGSAYLLSLTSALSDVDGDGVGAFPAFEDCAPFDANISPLHLDTPNDGVDSDCDGDDSGPSSSLVWQVTGGAENIPQGRPDLVLITIDSWRVDTTGTLVDARSQMPAFDVAKESVVFENAWSQDSGTGPSLWSLMAGKTPFQARVESSRRFPPNLLPTETTLAEHLSAAGYTTFARLCGAMFAKPHWNIRRGFDSYEEVCKGSRDEAATTTDAALSVLREPRKKPLFLWIHYFDPHAPYRDRGARDDSKWERYLSEVRHVDRHLRPVLDAVRGRERRTVLAITADHGENFDEHGIAPHARTLYNEVTHVPLLLWASDAAPQRITTPIAVGDIHPTFLHLANLDYSGSTMMSLAPLLYGGTAPEDRVVFQENSYSRPRRHVKAAVGHGHHFILDLTNGTTELYDLRRDPDELRDLSGQGLPVEAKLESLTRQFVTTTKLPAALMK